MATSFYLNYPPSSATISGTVSTQESGHSFVDSARNDYTGTNISTAAFVQLVASLASAAKGFFLFDSSGQTLELAIGAAASESRILIIPPGGIDGFVPLAIPAGTRISAKAISADAVDGEIDITFLG